MYIYMMSYIYKYQLIIVFYFLLYYGCVFVFVCVLRCVLRGVFFGGFSDNWFLVLFWLLECSMVLVWNFFLEFEISKCT